jgi:AraC-like DNA-binding protein
LQKATRLAKERTNYRQIVERVRFNAAISLLEDSENSIKDISYTLGYAHPGNFNRAFLRMSGVTPGRFRQKHQRTDRKGSTGKYR